MRVSETAYTFHDPDRSGLILVTHDADRARIVFVVAEYHAAWSVIVVRCRLCVGCDNSTTQHAGAEQEGDARPEFPHYGRYLPFRRHMMGRPHHLGWSVLSRAQVRLSFRCASGVPAAAKSSDKYMLLTTCLVGPGDYPLGVVYRRQTIRRNASQRVCSVTLGEFSPGCMRFAQPNRFAAAEPIFPMYSSASYSSSNP